MIRRYLPALAAFVTAAGLTLLAVQNAGTQAPPTETPCSLVLVTRYLALSPVQRQRVEELSADFQGDCRALRAQMRERRRDLFRLMAAPRPDQAAIDARMGEIAALQTTIQQHMVRHLLAVRQILTPEQQRKLFRLLDEAVERDMGRME